MRIDDAAGVCHAVPERRRSRPWWSLLALLLSLTGGILAAGEKGKPFVTAFEPSDYGGHPQNIAVTQADDGTILVANVAGILEYDGERWSMVEGTEGRPFFSLAVGPDGTVFAGSDGDFGFLRTDTSGSRTYVSMSAASPDLPAFHQVLSIVSTSEDVLFVDYWRVFVARSAFGNPAAAEIEVLSVAAPQLGQGHHYLGIHEGRPLFQKLGAGLLTYDQGELVPVPGGEFFATKSAAAGASLDDGSVLVLVLDSGIYRFDAGIATLETGAASELVRSAGSFGATVLRDGRVAVGTVHRGVALLDSSGALLDVFGRADGLPDSSVLSRPFEDRDGGGWLPLSYGLARIDVASGLERFDFTLGLEGPVLSVHRHLGTLYAGTYGGLFRLESASETGELARFTRVPGMPAPCWDLESVGDELWAATDRALERLPKAGPVRVEDEIRSAFTLQRTRDGRTVYVGTAQEGLFAVGPSRTTGLRRKHVADTTGQVRFMTEDEQGRIWFSHNRNGEQRIGRLDPSRSDAVRFYGPAEGVPDDALLQPFNWDGVPYAASGSALLRYDPDQDRFVTDDALVGVDDPQVEIVAIGVDDRQGLWLARGSDTPVVRITRDESGAPRFGYPFRGAGELDFQSLLYDKTSSRVWAGASSGVLISRRVEEPPPAAEVLSARIRSVTLSDGERVDPAGATIPFSAETLRFEYALPHFDAVDGKRYQTRLVGLDDDWGPWSKETYRDFAGLREGDYRFEVRGRTFDDRTSVAAAFAFQVLPPWHRTWWAYIAYAALILFGAAFYARIRLARSRRHMQRLEAEVAERKRAEHRLRDSQARYRSLVETIDDWVWECDSQLTITYSSPRVVEILGITPEQAVGRSAFDFMPSERADKVREPISTGVGFHQIEMVFLSTDGVEVEMEASGAPIREGAEVTGYRVVARDVRERRAIEQRLRRSERLESLGRLAGGVSHDFNNILTVLLGHISIMKGRLTRSSFDGFESELEIMEHATQRAADLTGNLLAFSRRQVVNPVVLDPNESIARLQKMLEHVIPESIEVRTELDPRVRRIFADGGQLDGAILNLVINARDAIRGKGTITISTGGRELDEDYLRDHHEATRGDHVVISVTDNGSGIEAGTLPHVFEPFFTTKEVGKGTGLGLASVHGMARQAGGHVTAESVPQRGTTFSLLFPVTDRVPEEAAPRRKPLSDGGGRTVLVCEDESAIRGLITLILEAHDYEVLMAGGAKEALELARSRADDIRLLITDVIMPEVNGFELAKSVLEIQPEIETLFMSGYSSDVFPVSDGESEAVELISKPFSPQELLERISQLLG